jgi:heat shock protein HslJ
MGSGVMRALVLAAALAACATPASAPGAAIHLSGTSWILDDADASPHFPTIRFEDARASGFDGCNSWFAAVTQEGEVLRFGPVATTRRACQAESAGAVERRFLAMLGATRYGHYDQDVLVLLDGEQHQLGRFNADR